MKAILTPDEVVFYGNVDRTFPRCELRLIFNVEITQFRSILGLDFYEELKSDLVDYSSVPEWQNQSYSKGDFVRFGSIIYEALEAGNTRPPSKDWRIADKFKSECNNYLWCNYLAEFLAMKVIRDRAGFLTYNLSGNGFQVVSQSNNRAVDGSEFSIAMQQIDRKISELFNNLDAFLKGELGGECSFEKYKGNKDCKDERTKSRNKYRVA